MWKNGNRRQDTIRVSCIGKCPGGTELDNHPQKAGRLPQSLLHFDAAQVAQMTDEDVERLMHFDGIVKNRLKIKSTITNAKLFLAIQKEFGSFYNYTLSFFPNRNPIINHFQSLSEIPVSSPESDAMSKDMKKRGFKFFGSTICYAHLQASGFINDHLTDCICRNQKQ